jgi:hypothetical protein
MVSGRTIFSHRVWVAVVIAAIPIIYFYPAVFGQVILLPGDGWTGFLGIRVLVGEMIAKGQMPLWNPYIFGGMPLLASIFAGVLYPPNWIFAFLPIKAASNILVITTFHISLTGCYLYARRIGINRCGSLITGIAFTFSAYLIVHLGHTSHIASAVWLPWIILSIEHLFHRFSWKWVSIGSFSIALQLFAGVPQMTLFTVITGGIYWLFAIVFRCSKSARLPFILASASMAVCGVLLSAIQLLPLRELQLQSPRKQLSYEFFSAYSLAPGQLMEIIFPFFFGGDTVAPFAVNFWGQWGFGETCGYIGIVTLVAVLVALAGERMNPLMWCWLTIAVIALSLSLGSFLPFGLHHLLFKVPVYNIFRASARHLYEFSFAGAVLAGLGINYLGQSEVLAARKALIRVTFVIIFVFTVVTVVYKFFGHFFASEIIRYNNAGNLTNFEAIVPWITLAFSLVGLWLYTQLRTPFCAYILVIILLADLMAFGHALIWRTIDFNVQERSAAPLSVKYIKSKEIDLNAFRVISDSPSPYDGWPVATRYEDLNWPNLSILHGLQSVNGYDMLQLQQIPPITGSISPEGELASREVFDFNHRGLDLLNVRYLIRERVPSGVYPPGVTLDGVGFHTNPMQIALRSGNTIGLQADGALADELVIVSNLSDSVNLSDGDSVLNIRITLSDGRVIEREVIAGRDTAEWAWDRSDVKPVIKHSKAKVVESFQAEGFQAHRYISKFHFDFSEVEKVDFKALRNDVSLMIARVSLFDSSNRKSIPLDTLSLDARRWRKLDRFKDIEVYENLRSLPRAWFVRRLEVSPISDVLKAVREGSLKDGRLFEPNETGLLGLEDFGGREVKLSDVGVSDDAFVKVTKYEPQRIELTTHNQQLGFLVLSENWYRGWEAWIDGKRTPVEKVNYALRGITVPVGDHHIEFVFRAHSFRTGSVYTLIGIIVLTFGVLFSYKRNRIVNSLSEAKALQ